MIRSTKLRESAKGEACTLRIVGVCNFNNETTVLAHLPDETHGMAQKSTDISACFACSDCHDAIDNRRDVGLTSDEREWYMRRAQTRTIQRWFDLGLINVL